MSLLNKIIAIKLAGQPKGLVGLSDLRSNLSCLTSSDLGWPVTVEHGI